MRFTTDNKFIIKWVLVDKYVEKRVFKMFFSEHSVDCSIMGLLQYEFMSPLI